MNPIRFGTDGIRGKVGVFPITEGGFQRIGQACREWLLQQKLPLIVAVGWDTRESGPVFAKAFAEGMGKGAVVRLLGVTPTPAISFYVEQENLSLGVSITASHNPYTDNGLKLFCKTGSKLRREEEEEIERYCQKEFRKKAGSVAMQKVSGNEYFVAAWKKRYPKDWLKGCRLVLDTANGATTFTTLPLLQLWGADVICLGNHPDGKNINRDCGSEHVDRLKAAVKEQHAWLGFAHDGDGDRLVVIDEHGERLNGDVLLGLLALDFHQQNALKRNCLVVPEESNSGLAESLKPFGIRVVTCAVGDRNVFYTLEKEGGCFGGESSGHMIFKDEAPTGDGLRALCVLLKLAKICPLWKRAQAITLRPKCERSLCVEQKIPLEQLTRLQATQARLQSMCGRVHIRYSGTENKLRFFVEADTLPHCEERMQLLLQAAAEDFQALHR